MLTLTKAEIRKLEPCKDSYRAACKLLAKHRSGWNVAYFARDAKSAGVDYDDVLWAACQLTDPDVQRRLRLFAADCAAHVLKHFEKDYPEDQQPRKTIETARAYARGQTDGAAQMAAWAAARAAGAAASVAWDVSAAARAAAWDAARAAAWDAEREWQYERLVAWLSDPEPKVWPLPKRPRPKPA